MFLSVFDVFKIGIGPSSSHTMGPMSAANRFLALLLSNEWPRPTGAHVAGLRVSLHGSLAFTGIGHGTGRAVILGLMGEVPQSVDPDRMDAIIETVERAGHVTPPGHPAYQFQPKTDLIFDKKQPLPGHANGMSFSALDRDSRLLVKRIYYSIGGGFVVTDTELEAMRSAKASSSDARVPFPFSTAKAMLEMSRGSGLTIAQMKRANEETKMSPTELDEGLDGIWNAMTSCIDRGLKVDGIMPGGLKVRRRARAIHDKLNEEWRSNRLNPLLANDWLSVYAMAVNEENAGGGRVVTAPTNGAAGVIPATIRYYLHFHEDASREDVHNFLHQAQCLDFRRRSGLPGRSRVCCRHGCRRSCRGHGRITGADRECGRDRT
jgi:L-serine dehydratase